MRKQFTIILTLFMLASCVTETTKETANHNAPITKTSEIPVDSTTKSIHEVDYSDSINFTDSHGWKQGKWIRKWKGKLVESYTYVNDTLHGHYETDQGEGYYKHGQKDGLQFAYYGEKESILMVNYYTNGTHVWGGFPAAGRDMVIPLKDFHISVDSTYVKAPYINGQTWYEGNFCLLPDSINNGKLLPHRYGIHKIYHMNGNIKGIVDYDEEIVQEFDSTGKRKYQAHFNEWKIHNLPTLGRYRKNKNRR